MSLPKNSAKTCAWLSSDWKSVPVPMIPAFRNPDSVVSVVTDARALSIRSIACRKVAGASSRLLRKLWSIFYHVRHGGMAFDWLARTSHSAEIMGSILGSDLPVSSMHALPISAWIVKSVSSWTNVSYFFGPAKNNTVQHSRFYVEPKNLIHVHDFSHLPCVSRHVVLNRWKTQYFCNCPVQWFGLRQSV